MTDKALMKKLKQVLGGKSSTTKEADHIKIPFPFHSPKTIAIGRLG